MKRILFITCALLLWITAAQAATTLQKSWLFVSDDPTIRLEWDGQAAATKHEVKMISMFPTQEWLQTVPGTTVSFNRPRSGLFRFAVRACDDSACSEWSYSDGPTAAIKQADGSLVLQPWIVFCRLSAPIPH